MQIRMDVEDATELKIMHRAMDEILTRRDYRRSIGAELRAEFEAADEADVRRGVAKAAMALSEENLAPVDVNNAMVEGQRWDTDDTSDVLSTAPQFPQDIGLVAREVVTTPAEPVTGPAPTPEIVTVDPAELTAAMRGAAGRAGLPAAVEVLKRFGVTRVPDLAPAQGRPFLDALAALPAVVA